MTERFAWFSVAGTILLTIYGQLIIKWRFGGLELPAPFGGKLYVVGRHLFDLWVISALAAAVIASLCWMAAMTRLPLSVAYPFTSLSFLIITFLGITFMGEALTVGKVAGAFLVVAGLVLVARG